MPGMMGLDGHGSMEWQWEYRPWEWIRGMGMPGIEWCVRYEYEYGMPPMGMGMGMPPLWEWGSPQWLSLGSVEKIRSLWITSYLGHWKPTIPIEMMGPGMGINRHGNAWS